MLIKALFFPQKCLICNQYSTDTICLDCLNNSKFVYIPFCPVCQQPSIEGQTHYYCKTTLTPNILITPFYFQGPIKTAIKSSKYRKNCFSLINYLVKYTLPFSEQFNYHLFTGYTLCAVPADKNRLQKRGFNLPNIICDSLSKNLGLKQNHILKKQKQTPPLYKLAKKERPNAVKGAFCVKKSSVIPKNVCLVDDIFTTGATMNEACKTLKKAGVQNVICFALSYQPLNKIDN